MATIDLTELEEDPRLFLYTSLTAGSSHIITATSRLETILKANRIPFVAVDTATDEKARKLWGRRAGKLKLPGLVKEGYILGIEEWNEFGELHENIGDVPPAGTVPPNAAKIQTIRPTAAETELQATSSSLPPAGTGKKVDTKAVSSAPAEVGKKEENSAAAAESDKENEETKDAEDEGSFAEKVDASPSPVTAKGPSKEPTALVDRSKIRTLDGEKLPEEETKPIDVAAGTGQTEEEKTPAEETTAKDTTAEEPSSSAKEPSTPAKAASAEEAPASVSKSSTPAKETTASAPDPHTPPSKQPAAEAAQASTSVADPPGSSSPDTKTRSPSAPSVKIAGSPPKEPGSHLDWQHLDAPSTRHTPEAIKIATLNTSSGKSNLPDTATPPAPLSPPLPSSTSADAAAKGEEGKLEAIAAATADEKSPLSSEVTGTDADTGVLEPGKTTTSGANAGAGLEGKIDQLAAGEKSEEPPAAGKIETDEATSASKTQGQDAKESDDAGVSVED